MEAMADLEILELRGPREVVSRDAERPQCVPRPFPFAQPGGPRFIHLGGKLGRVRIEYRFRRGGASETGRLGGALGRMRGAIGGRLSRQRQRRRIKDPAFARQVRKEIAAICREVWELYCGARPSRRRELRVFLVESIAEAQAFSVDVPVVNEMIDELRRLVRNGAVRLA